MEEEDISKIKQLLMEAPLGYQPKPSDAPKKQEDDSVSSEEAAQEIAEKIKQKTSFSSNVVAFQQPN